MKRTTVEAMKDAMAKALALESSYGKPYMVSIACRLCVLAEQGNVEAARLIWNIMSCMTANSQKTDEAVRQKGDKHEH